MTDKSTAIKDAFGMTDEEVASATGNVIEESKKTEEIANEEQVAEKDVDKKEKTIDKAEELGIDERFRVYNEDGSFNLDETVKKLHGGWAHLKSEVGRTGQELGELRKKWNATYMQEQKAKGVEKPTELTEEKLNELLTTDLKSFTETIKKEVAAQIKREMIEEQQKHMQAIDEDANIFAQEVSQWYKSHPEAQELEDDMGKIFGEYPEADRIKMAADASSLMDMLYLKAENRRLKEKMKYQPKTPAQENKSVASPAKKQPTELAGRAKMIADAFGMTEEDIEKNIK